ncbi:hypothetical protein P9112_002380 [Eukaryota sp. TZLM1-RC]
MSNEEQFQQLVASFEKVHGKQDDVAPLGNGVQETTSASDDLYSADISFEQLGVDSDICKAISGDLRFVAPSQVQAQSIPKVLSDPPRNCIVQSQSGTGKTLAFALGSLCRIDRSKLVPQVIVLCGTRELARQVATLFYTLVKHTDPVVKVATVLKGGGGAPVSTSNPHYAALPSEAHIVVGTAGSILASIGRKQLDPSNLKVLVLDEADELLKGQGAESHVMSILRQLPPDSECQRLLFSATFPAEQRKFIIENFPRPQLIMKSEQELPLSCILNVALNVNSPEDREALFRHLMSEYSSLGQTIVFLNRRDEAKRLHTALSEIGFGAELLTGDLQPEERDQIFDSFENNKIQVLIATHVLHRGVDVRHVVFVFNYDLPFDRDGSLNMASYLHRIGRTGRFGRRGIAVNFTSGDLSKEPSETHQAIDAIRHHYKIPLPYVTLEQLKQLVDKIDQEEGGETQVLLQK